VGADAEGERERDDDQQVGGQRHGRSPVGGTACSPRSGAFPPGTGPDSDGANAGGNSN